MSVSESSGQAPKRLLLGVISGAHGIKGEVVIKSFTADPLDIDAYGPLTDSNGRTYAIEALRVGSKGVVARIKGIADRNAAEKLAKIELFVDRDLLPATSDEDEFYHTDLIGLAARLADGTPFGRVVGLPNFGAGDLIEIAPTGGGPTRLLPFTKACIPVVDLKGGFLLVDPPEEIEVENDGAADNGDA